MWRVPCRNGAPRSPTFSHALFQSRSSASGALRFGVLRAVGFHRYQRGFVRPTYQSPPRPSPAHTTGIRPCGARQGIPPEEIEAFRVEATAANYNALLQCVLRWSSVE